MHPFNTLFTVSTVLFFAHHCLGSPLYINIDIHTDGDSPSPPIKATKLKTSRPQSALYTPTSPEAPVDPFTLPVIQRSGAPLDSPLFLNVLPPDIRVGPPLLGLSSQAVEYPLLEDGTLFFDWADAVYLHDDGGLFEDVAAIKSFARFSVREVDGLDGQFLDNDGPVGVPRVGDRDDYVFWVGVQKFSCEGMGEECIDGKISILLQVGAPIDELGLERVNDYNAKGIWSSELV